MISIKHLVIPITAILVAMILGGSFIAVQYYKQKSIERQQTTKLEQEKKDKEAEAEIEMTQRSALTRCLDEAETDYWAYMEINGTKKADETIYADDKFWAKADKDKQNAIENCNERYKNKSFNRSIFDN